MHDTALQTCLQTNCANFPASHTGGIRVPGQHNPATNTVLDGDAVETIERALCATGYPALRGVQVEIERGIAVLKGRVPSYHQKQLAQATVQRVAGIVGVDNGIEVVCCR